MRDLGHTFQTFNRYSFHTYFAVSMETAFDKFMAHYDKTEDEAIELYDFDGSI